MPVIDVHTHNFTRGWLDLLRSNGGQYGLKMRPDGREEIFRGDTPVAIPQPGHFDYDLRIRTMDESGIDLSIVSLTCPNVYWGKEEVSCRAARDSNDTMRDAQTAYPAPERGDHPGRLASESGRWRRGIQPGAVVHVDVVDTTRLELHGGLARGGGGHGDLLVLERLGTAGRVDASAISR